MVNTAIHFLRHAIPHIGEKYGEILLNGFEEKQCHPIQASHFSPCTHWKEDGDFFLIDAINGDRYLYDTPSTKRLKCLALVGATLIVHAISIVLDIANRIAKLLTFAHFWHSCSGRDYVFTARLCDCGGDLLRIIWDPISYVGLELSAIYGLILPYDGGKLYATFERATFGEPFLAPCFQPEPQSHLGGGDLNVRDSW